jgi:tetratricopeptide (TPR) repeat protein
VSEDELYRPLPLTVFAATWQLFPNNPLPGHIINILLYAVTAYFLFMLLARILKAYSLALPFLAVLLFVVHPLHTEVVANIKSFDELLSFLFALVALKFTLDYLEKNNFWRMMVAMLAFFIAYLSKEATITMLVIIPLTIYFFRDIPMGKIYKALGYLLIPTVIYLGIRRSVIGSITSTKHFAFIDNVLVNAHSIGERWATAFKILGKYFLMLVYPNPLSSDYSYPQINLNGWNNPWAIVSFFLCTALLVYGVIGLKKKKILAYTALFYLLSMVLYSNLFVIIGSPFAERFMYVSSLGFTLALAWGLLKISNVNVTAINKSSVVSALSNKKLWLASFVIILPFSLRTITRNPDWETYMTLYSADARNTPDCARMHFLLGYEIQQKKINGTDDEKEKTFWLDSSIVEFNHAIQLYPGYANAYSRMAKSYLLKGNDSLAYQFYSKALELNPENATNYDNFGMYYFMKNDLEPARDLYIHAVTLNPRYAEAWRNLGSTYGKMEQYDKSMDAFKNSLKYEPDNADALYFLGITYRAAGQEDHAQFYIRKSENLKKTQK